VWNKAHALTLVIYEVSETFPAGERYGLTSQIRRAAASIPTNIAEGCGRSSSADFGRFLQMAMGSASELEYLLMLARDLRMLASRPTIRWPVTLRRSRKCSAPLSCALELITDN
jgi:four helix bundle protein